MMFGTTSNGFTGLLQIRTLNAKIVYKRGSVSCFSSELGGVGASRWVVDVNDRNVLRKGSP